MRNTQNLALAPFAAMQPNMLQLAQLQQPLRPQRMNLFAPPFTPPVLPNPMIAGLTPGAINIATMSQITTVDIIVEGMNAQALMVTRALGLHLTGAHGQDLDHGLDLILAVEVDPDLPLFAPRAFRSLAVTKETTPPSRPLVVVCTYPSKMGRTTLHFLDHPPSRYPSQPPSTTYIAVFAGAIKKCGFV
ncbi:hypothetical protein IFR05_003340 [Cadophora sp. M221]|nr:hypothetical protein IFR05_003340 [Cadophora sp. M221]